MTSKLMEIVRKFLFLNIEVEINPKEIEKLKEELSLRWGGDLRIFSDYDGLGEYRHDKEIILHADAALQLKERGYEAVVGIKNAGIPYAKIFKMMGYIYSEIDFSQRKRKMQEPEMSEGEISKLKHKKVILAEADFISGATLQKVIKHLVERDISAGGAYIGHDCWTGQPGITIESFGKIDHYWKTEKRGLRRLNNKFLYNQGMIPDDFEIFTFTDECRINEAIKRVSEYLKEAGKI